LSWRLRRSRNFISQPGGSFGRRGSPPSQLGRKNAHFRKGKKTLVLLQSKSVPQLHRERSLKEIKKKKKGQRKEKGKKRRKKKKKKRKKRETKKKKRKKKKKKGTVSSKNNSIWGGGVIFERGPARGEKVGSPSGKKKRRS